jgi:hypothetical protein
LIAILVWGRGIHRDDIEAFIARVDARQDQTDDDTEGLSIMKDRARLFHELRVKNTMEQ